MWNDLTLKEKAEIMKMSVANGVTDINDIQQLYDDSIGYKFDNGSYFAKTLPELEVIGTRPGGPNENWREYQNRRIKDKLFNSVFPNYWDTIGAPLEAIMKPFETSYGWLKDTQPDLYYSLLKDTLGTDFMSYATRDQRLFDDGISFAQGGHMYAKAGPLNKAKQQPKYQYGIIEQVLRENGVNFRVTSGARKPNQAGNAGKGSAHTYTIFGNSPGAIDIVPGVGSDWNTLFAQMNSPRVRKALAAYGLDVLNETNPSVMASTHATGPHLHVGRGIKGQTGMGQMFGGTSYGGGKGDMYAPTYGSRGSSSSRGYDSGYQNFTGDIEPITIEGGNRDNGWLNYVASVNKPISFNTPIGATNLDSNLSNAEFTPTDFSMLDSDVEIATPLNPTVAKRNMEYSLGLENNALWNSPYLMFNAHSGANGGHLYEDGSMLLRNNAVNPLMQYVYGPEYEEIVRNNRNYVPSGNIVRNKPRYNIKQEADVVANTTKPIQKSIRRKQTSESVARRDKEQQQHDAMENQYRIERQGTISQTPDRMRHPDYDPVKANEVQQRYEQNEIAEQNAYNRRVLEHNVLEGMEAVPWPSTIAGSLFNPNTHWYNPGSFFENLYANDNRGFFNYNQATRNFYDANPEVGSVANLIGDFVVPGAAAKALKGVGKAGKFAATDVGDAWKTMRYELAHPEAQTYGIVSNNFNMPKLNDRLRNFGNKLDNTVLKIGNAEMRAIDNVKNGVANIKDKIYTIANGREKPLLERIQDYGALSNDQLNSLSYEEALKYPDFVSYAFTNSETLHPNFPAGSTRRDIMNAMAGVENKLASRPRFSSSEFLGHDFSGQSVQMILNRIDKLQKKLI